MYWFPYSLLFLECLTFLLSSDFFWLLLFVYLKKFLSPSLERYFSSILLISHRTLKISLFSSEVLFLRRHLLLVCGLCHLLCFCLLSKFSSLYWCSLFHHDESCFLKTGLDLFLLIQFVSWMVSLLLFLFVFMLFIKIEFWRVLKYYLFTGISSVCIF